MLKKKPRQEFGTSYKSLMLTFPE